MKFVVSAKKGRERDTPKLSFRKAQYKYQYMRSWEITFSQRILSVWEYILREIKIAWFAIFEIKINSFFNVKIMIVTLAEIVTSRSPFVHQITKVCLTVCLFTYLFIKRAKSPYIIQIDHTIIQLTIGWL